MVTTLPYGSWPSPISAELLATGGTRLGGPQLVGDEVWWTEGIATEEGRNAIVRTDGPVHRPEDAPGQVTVLPSPFSSRSRVHEYGGTAWTALPAASDGAERPLVLFVNFTDQRIHAFREGERPRPLSPVGPEVTTAGGPSLRWACPTPVTLPGGTGGVVDLRGPHRRRAGPAHRGRRRPAHRALHRCGPAGRLRGERPRRDPPRHAGLPVRRPPAAEPGRRQPGLVELGASADALGRHEAACGPAGRRVDRGRHRGRRRR